MAELHLVATAFMTGLIVFVQVVHYPLMARVDHASFVRYERAHTARTGWVVIPPMVAELGAAVWLVVVPPAPQLQVLAWTGVLLLGVVWFSTALLQAPAHAELMRGFEAGVHRRLVRTNWLRTAAWAARLVIAVVLVVAAE